MFWFLPRNIVVAIGQEINLEAGEMASGLRALALP